MSEQVVPNVGHLAAEGARRDAIHVAVIPVVAAESLKPGANVIMRSGKAEWAESREVAVGIVDPFLQDVVQEGQTFWLFLFPGTITSLRHVWTHPKFVAKLPIAMRVENEGE